MQNNTHSEHADRIRNAGRIVIGRVIRILHACGLSSSELLGIAQSEIADLRGPSVSQVLATTREILLCSNVLLRWRRDPQFISSEGLPLPLSVDNGPTSFSNLVRSVDPGVPFDMVLGKMRQLGAVRDTSPDMVEVLTDSILTCTGQDGHVVASESVLDHIGGYLGSVEHNLINKPERQLGRFERACYAVVPRGVVPVLERLIGAKGQDFVDSVDEWLSRRVASPNQQDGTVVVGAGAYVFIENDERRFRY